MVCRTTRHLVRTVAVLLLLGLESLSRAAHAPARPRESEWEGQQQLAGPGDYVPQHRVHQQQHQHQHHQHHQRQQQQQSQGRQRYQQASLGNSSSYSLISGPRSSSNGGTDYRPPAPAPATHHLHQHWLTGGVGRGGTHQDTPPQHHRRHHHARGQAQPNPPSHPQHPYQPQQPALANSWRRTLVSSPEGEGGDRAGGRSGGTGGNGQASRPVTRMLTRSGTSSFDGTRQGNNTSKNICTVYMYRKTVRTPHSMQPCLDLANCGQRTYSYPVAKRETCCRGWETTTTIADGCMKPICQTACRNGGKCTAPDRCSCPAGFTGKSCELDVNECKEHKPCDQTCYNTEGSYYCTCRDGFMLQADRQSCKKIDETNDLATEARDMENDVDYDSLDIRLKKLEQMISHEERRSNSEKQELNKKMQYTLDTVSVLKSQVARLSQRLFPSVDYGNRVH